MVKQLSTVRNTQRDSQSYIEKRKGRNEIEVTRGRKGRVKRGESNQVKVQVTQSCPTLCNPMDSIVHGILQARILEWVAVPFSRGSFQPRD